MLPSHSALPQLCRWTALTTLTVLIACSGKGSDDDSAVDTGSLLGDAQERAACAQTSESGPVIETTNQVTAQAPALQILDSPYTIKLFQDRGGYVRLTADATTAGPRVVFTGFTDSIINIIDELGAPVDFTQVPGTACPETIAARVELDLAEGTVWALFGPSPHTTVWTMTSQQ